MRNHCMVRIQRMGGCLLGALMTCAAQGALNAPRALTVERTTDPIGVDAARPRLGWQLPEGVKRQTAYEIEADGWSSGKVASSENVDVIWGGDAWTTSSRIGWRVRVWDERDAVSAWSERQTMVMGVRDVSDWKAQWIGANPATTPDVDFAGAQWLEGSVFATAFAYEGKGVCEFVLASTEAYHVFLNGREFFACMGQVYDGRHIRLFDLTRSLKAGRNELKVVVRGGGDAETMAHRGDFKRRAILGLVRQGGRAIAVTDAGWGGKALGGAREPSFARAIDFSEEMASPAFVKRFAAKASVKRATLHVTGLGFYEAYLNGKRIGRKVIDPSPTDYDERVLYSTYVLDGQLKSGENELKLLVGHGWYDMRSVATWNYDQAPWRTRPKAIAQLEIDYADGTKAQVVTDGSWEQVDSPVIYDCIREGEVTGGRTIRQMRVAAGTKAQVVAAPKGRLVAETMPGAEVVAEFSPSEVRNLGGGRAIVTFPKEVSGWAALTLRGLSAGDEVTVRYDESLKPDGTVTDPYVPGPWRPMTDNDRSIDRFFQKTRSQNFRGAASGMQTDHFISAGGAVETHEPRFVWHGFRHLIVDGLKTPLEPGDAKAKLVRTAFAETGTFACSNPILNDLVEHARQSYRCNFTCGYPTDCPHREKLGWTGDGWIASELGLGYFDTAAAYEKWFADVVDTQFKSGRLCSIAPTGGWGYEWFTGPVFDAVVGMLPWNLWRFCGDRAAIDKAYGPLKAYLAYEKGIESAPGLVKNGLGDWNAANRKHMPESEYVISCFYMRLKEVAAQMAEVKGLGGEAQAFRASAGETRRAIHAKYAKGDGVFANGLQTAQALAVLFDLAEGAEAAAAGRKLVEACEADGGHIDFGLVGAKTVYRALAKIGRADVAYRMIVNPTAPSMVMWLGRTGCLWEDFTNGFSKCHVMLGDFAAWCQQVLAGITPAAPGYRKIRIAPQPVEGLDWAEATVGTPYGRVMVRWERKDGAFRLTADVPAGTTAEVRLPGGKTVTVGPGRSVLD